MLIRHDHDRTRFADIAAGRPMATTRREVPCPPPPVEEGEEATAAGESVTERVLRLLEVFSRPQPPLTLSKLAEKAGLPVSTAYRLTRHLSERGALRKDSRGRYSVGPMLVEIVSAAGHDSGAIDPLAPAATT